MEGSASAPAAGTLLKKPDRLPRKYLVYTSAGDKANLQSWLGEHREFDLWITYYGDTPGRYLDAADYYNARKGSKFQNLRYAYDTWEPLLHQYVAIFVMDDDVIIDTGGINRLFRIRDEFDYWVLQPAFSPWGKIYHEITRARRHCVRRHTNYVEVTCPLIRRDLLDRFMKVYNPVLVGWGVEWWLLHFIGPDLRDRVAIIDAVPCTNPHDRTKGGREIDRLQSAAQRLATWNRIRAQHGIESEKRGRVEYRRFRKPISAALLLGMLWESAELAIFAPIRWVREAWWSLQALYAQRHR